MRSDHQRLLDVIEAIEYIERYSAKGRDAFEQDELIQTWMIHYLQIIGEAVARLSESFRKNNPEVSWMKIRGMRNILVHDYFGIDLSIVWNAIENEIPNLKTQVEKIIDIEDLSIDSCD